MNEHTQTLSYEYFRRLSQKILEIDEVTTFVLLSTETSLTTESIILLNSRILASTRSRTKNLKYYRDSCNQKTTRRFAEGGSASYGPRVYKAKEYHIFFEAHGVYILAMEMGLARLSVMDGWTQGGGTFLVDNANLTTGWILENE